MVRQRRGHAAAGVEFEKELPQSRPVTDPSMRRSDVLLVLKLQADVLPTGHESNLREYSFQNDLTYDRVLHTVDGLRQCPRQCQRTEICPR